jgi:hypothetical protein
MSATPAPDGEFWEAAAALLVRPGVSRSTMMGYPCLRLHGDFFASFDPHHDALVVKLDRSTVADLIIAGMGEPFAPNGRQFREWISIPARSSHVWPDHLDTAFDRAVERAARPL